MYTSNQTIEYSLNLPSRCISSVSSDKYNHRFMVGTCFTPGTYQNQYNEIHLLKYDEEVNDLIVEAIYHHEIGEVWSLQPCPTHEQYIVTAGTHQTTLWKVDIPNTNSVDDVDTTAKPLTEIFQLNSTSRTLNIKWNPNQELQMASLTTNELYHWDLNQQTLSQKTPIAEAYALSYDPHSSTTIACAHARSISLFDIRSSSPSLTLHNIHRRPMCSIDYNPTRPNILVSSSQDSILKFHDIRNPSIPLKICRNGHSHWINSVKYNPFHDQLLLSCGTDSIVNLWRVSSISSAPLLQDEEEEQEEQDIRVLKYEGQDSIYDLTWSTADAWCFCSVGFDGNVVLHHVPSKEKYKILL